MITYCFNILGSMLVWNFGRSLEVDIMLKLLASSWNKNDKEKLHLKWLNANNGHVCYSH